MLFHNAKNNKVFLYRKTNYYTDFLYIRVPENKTSLLS